ncbi:MAG: PAS domain S-box protein [Spirochaetia bacterium]|nr:PAS domain S-box protein [Spirochaetia bacterium]
MLKESKEIVKENQNDLSALFNISQTLTTTLNLETVLQTVIDNASQLAKLDSGAIYLVQKDELYLGATTPPLPPEFPEHFRKAKLKDHPHIEQSISKRYPIAVDNVSSVKLSTAEKEIIQARNLHSLLYLPLIVENRSVGVLILGTIGKPRVFSDSDITLYHTVSNQMALAVENAVLYQEKQNYISALEEQVALRTAELTKTNNSLKNEIFKKEKIEKALTESEKKYRDIINTTQEGYWLTNKNQETADVNDSLCKMLGYTREEMLGKKPFDFVDEKNANILKEQMARLSVTFHREYEVDLKHKNGKDIHTFFHATTLKDNNNKPIGCFAFISNLTELKKSEQRYKRLVQMAPFAIILHDGKNPLLVNEMAVKILKASSEQEVLDGQVMQVVHPDSIETVRERIITMMKTNQPQPIVEEKFIRLDGKTIDVEVAAAPVEYKGEKVIQVAFQDISERKKAEFELRKAKNDAEEANSLKDKFVALVSHDLKNPLNAVSGYFQLLQSVTSHTAEEKDWINEGLRASSEMNNLINEILNLSKIKSGKIKIKHEFFNAKSIVEKVIKNFISISNKKKILIINELPLYTRIFADERLFTEAVSNVMSNAIKFCKENDIIKIYLAKENPITIAVEDTGVGIHPKSIPHLFKYEEKTTTIGTHGELGTGFGMPLVYDIFKAHDGNIYVESTLQKGSTFFLELPNITPRVLIVEDKKAERNLLKKYLEKLNLNFTEAENGRQAVKILDKEIPHLILLDINMPDMNGFEFLEYLKSKETLKTIPALVITIEDKIETRDQIFTYGADDFITKPITIENLEPRVRRFTA